MSIIAFTIQNKRYMFKFHRMKLYILESLWTSIHKSMINVHSSLHKSVFSFIFVLDIDGEKNLIFDGNTWTHHLMILFSDVLILFIFNFIDFPKNTLVKYILLVKIL